MKQYSNYGWILFAGIVTSMVSLWLLQGPRCVRGLEDVVLAVAFAGGLILTSYGTLLAVLSLSWSDRERKSLQDTAGTVRGSARFSRVWRLGWFLLVVYLSISLLGTVYSFLPKGQVPGIWGSFCLYPARSWCAVAEVAPEAVLAEFTLSASDWPEPCIWVLDPSDRVSIMGIPLRVRNREVFFGRYRLALGEETSGFSILIPVNPWLITVRAFTVRLAQNCPTFDGTLPVRAYVHGTIQTRLFLNPVGPMGVVLALWLRHRL